MMFLINTPQRSAVLGGLFGGLTYGSITYYTSLAVNQAVNVAISTYLTPVLGSVLGCYAGWFLPALLSIGVGALMGYLLFQFTISPHALNEENQTTSIDYDYIDYDYNYNVTNSNSLPPFISFQKFTNKEIYQFYDGIDENEVVLTRRP